MANSVHWIVEMQVQPGKLGEFKKLMEDEMVPAAKAEPGVLDYEWFLGVDQLVSIHERYRDAVAAKEHSAKFHQKFAPRFFALARAKRFLFLGAPPKDVSDSIKAPTEALEQIGGFSRQEQ